MLVRQLARGVFAPVLALVPALWLSAHVLAQAPQLPPQAQFEGELEVQIEDSVSGSRSHHFLTTDNGRRLKLELPGDGPGWLTGSQVRARGRLKDEETLELGSANDLEPMALANPNTLGAQRTIVILVNFQDSPQIPYDWTHANNVTFNTTNSFFLENSHNQSWLTGVVVGWYTLAMNSTSCNYDQISSLADQAATAGGANLSQYSRKVYAFPQTGACGWWGLGTVGGNPSRAWINGPFALKVVAHELGHNFGDYHSRSRACEAGGCSVSEYGDDADVMGNPTSGHMNAFQKERLGWLNYGDTPAIQNVSQSGAYWIDAYAPVNPAATAPKALKILKDVDGGGRRTWYYVEARTQAGFDGGVAPGAILHTGSEVSGREVYELDLLPATSSKDWRLDAGQTFEDAALGVRVTTLWADSTGAMIDVQFDAAPCAASAPSISASPAGTVTTDPGAAVTYTVGVANHDDLSCGSSTFDVEAWVPAGWSWSASPSSVAIAAGGTGNATVVVTPSANATGSNDVQLGAYRSSGPGASVVRTVEVNQTPASGPLGATLSIADERKGTVFTVTVGIEGAPVSGAVVELTLLDPAGAVVRTFSGTTNGNGQVSWSFKARRRDPTGTYTAIAVATSDGQTATATAQHLVN